MRNRPSGPVLIPSIRSVPVTAAAGHEPLVDGQPHARTRLAVLVNQAAGHRAARLEDDPDRVGLVALEVDRRAERSSGVRDDEGLGLAGVGVDEGPLVTLDGLAARALRPGGRGPRPRTPAARRGR